MIHTILSKLSGNVTEAADLMHKAAMHRDTCRDLATWCQEMATSHLGFNSSGRKILSRHLDAMGNDPTAIGKREAYTAWLNAIDAEASAVQAQIDVFNR